MKPKPNRDRVSLLIRTQEGKFVAHYSVEGLIGLEFPSKRSGPAVAPTAALPETIRRWHRATAIALKRALAGRSARVLPPLDLSEGTAFQQRVWNALLKIPRGHTRSYGDIARAVGKANAARAVGTACGANPIPVFVPCHRVITTDHKLGGFSGGLDWKRLLLWREESRDWWEGDEKPPA
jgi:O-6-methylguanine DNA methyltransferase